MMTTDAKLKTGAVTREALLAAMAEYDRDAAAFHKAHRTTERGCRYWIQHAGKRYPSKAIVAAASSASTAKFSGGASRLGPMLERLGFKLGSLAIVATAAGVIAGAAPAHPETAAAEARVEATYFASGSNTPAQIRGFAAIGQAIGVVAPRVSENGENVLHGLAGTGIPVFIDSGAFGEVEFAPGPQVVRPISEAQWQDTMDLYARLAASLGSQLYVVAPDMVGFQGATLERIARWKEEIRALISTGANVIVVAQKGEDSQTDFDAKVEKILGTSDYVRGMPCNKAATTPAEVLDFAKARKPARMHMLGLGLRNKDLPEYADAVAQGSPETRLSLDSCLICESVGKTNGRVSHPREVAGGPRVFTWAKDQAKRLIASGKTLVRDVEDLAIRLAWGDGQVALC